MGLFNLFSGNTLARYQTLAQAVSSRERELRALSDDELKRRFLALREKALASRELASFLPDVFAFVREASVRTLGQRHFDVQLLGGMALFEGQIAEMKTGEGKTLVATLPAALEGLGGRGVHIVTVNDYLAMRDTVWMGQIYHFLGLSVGCLTHEASYIYDPTSAKEISNFLRQSRESSTKSGQFPISKQVSNLKSQISNDDKDKERDTVGAFRVVHEFLRPINRKEAYDCDVLYGTNHEFGFDYLRDHLVEDGSQAVQRGHNYAIIDEVDSILIDEARTPLIISVPDHDAPKLWEVFAKVVRDFSEERDYTVDRKRRTISLTPEGIERAEKTVGLSNLYSPEGFRYLHFLEQSVRARALFERDKDYVVKNGEIIIVDEFTGRLMHGRRWSDGLHQAVEAKEGVAVQAESRTVATITLQNYFRMYEKLAGMTGTAMTSAEEFEKVYHLEVVAIPTHRPMIRQNLSDRIYQTERAKWQAVVEEVRTRHKNGQPVLIGTVSIERNEHLSGMLRSAGISHQILNAKNHEDEAQIIAQAGRLSAVTVATNMAGRGVDIILGGNPPDEAGRAKVLVAGGLHVLGTERHEARRIDNQLRGRSGRQGDAGSSQFFVSLEDDLMRIFGGERIKSLMQRLKVKEDQPVEHALIGRSIAAAQSKVEGFNFDLRKHLLEYDDVLNAQRKAVYRERERLLDLDGDETEKEIDSVFDGAFDALDLPVAETASQEERINTFKQLLSFLFPGVSEGRTKPLLDNADDIEKFKQVALTLAKEVWQEKSGPLDHSDRAALVRRIFLSAIDTLWLGHLEAMEHLREAVRLRAYGQRDPLVEYKTEGRKLWQDFWDRFRESVTLTLLRMEITREQASTPKSVWGQGRGSQIAAAPVAAGVSNPHKIGRNDPCWCGAKHPDSRPKKYKKCHGQ